MRANFMGRAIGSLIGRARVSRIVLALLALLVVPTFASAAPITYQFTSGTVTLRAILDDGTVTSVLSGPSPVSVLLGGTSVTFDPAGGINGSLIDFELVPASVLNLDLNEALVGLDTISVLNARLVNDTSTQSFVSPTGEFFVNTIMTGDVSGFLPGGIPFGPESVTSLDSEVTGTLGLAGDSITFNLSGINIARFAQLPGPGPDVLVKADFTFFGVVPEPGTALLIGLGLAGLSASRRANAVR
jgi:hypothetical protein